MKDGGQGPGWQSCLLQIEQRACVNFAILGGSPSSGVLGLGSPDICTGCAKTATHWHEPNHSPGKTNTASRPCLRNPWPLNG